jgi:hypothetical protein
MVIAGVVPPQLEEIALRDTSSPYEMRIKESERIFVLVGPPELTASQLELSHAGQVEVCRVLDGELRGLVYVC